jgi:hydrogenase nickel incorporation protein HypA/HybF
MLMHETAVAESVFETIVEQAKKFGARPVCTTISCGTLNPINDEILNFAFEAAAKGSVCEGMKLKIVHIPLKAKCKSCGETFEFDLFTEGCKSCKGSEIGFEPDAPLLLEEIEFEDKK